jgi:hypothetical protein
MQLLRILPITALLSACAVDAPGDELESAPSVATATSAVTAVPAFRSFAHVQNGTSVMQPAGLMAGDFLHATLEYDATPVQIVPPTGWTLVADQISGAGTAQVFHALVYSHVATANEPADYMFDAPAGVYVDIQITDYTGVSKVDQTAGVGVITAPNLFTTAANELLVSFFVAFDFGSWSVATGETQRSNFDANSVQDVVIPVAGSPTLKRPASTTTTQQAAINILIK